MPRSPVFNRDWVLAAYDTEGNKCKYCPRHLKPPGNHYRSFMTHLLGCKSFLESSTALGLESSVPPISKAIKEEVSNAHNYYILCRSHNVHGYDRDAVDGVLGRSRDEDRNIG